MTWTHRRLVPALACSLLLHALPFLPLARPPAKQAQPTAVLEAHLRLPPPPPAQPPLRLPEPPRAPAPRKPEPVRKTPLPAESPPARAAQPKNWTAEVKRQLRELDRQGKFYPEEAIARGLEGEAVVLFLLDEAGNVAAARIEESSGHRILDEAALRAVRSLKSLPAAAPREAVMPVRFRLR